MGIHERTDFYAHLRKKHATLEDAIQWAIRWAQEQPVLLGFGSFTVRALAFHISSAFEGKSDEWGMDAVCDYMSTKHGVRICHAMWTGRDDG